MAIAEAGEECSTGASNFPKELYFRKEEQADSDGRQLTRLAYGGWADQQDEDREGAKNGPLATFSARSRS